MQKLIILLLALVVLINCENKISISHNFLHELNLGEEEASKELVIQRMKSVIKKYIVRLENC